MWQAQPCIFLLNQCCESHYIEADPVLACHFYADPDPACHFDSDPDTSFHSNLENVLKYAHLSHILACHLQIVTDPDPTFQVDADPQNWL
jgi:hypothetical protein